MEAANAYQTSFVAELYDHVISFKRRPDIDFYIRQALRAGGVALEIGCGTGRILIPLARTGVPVVGLDYSSAMLDVCERKLAREPLSVRSMVESIELANMNCFDLDRSFNLITFPFYTFNYLLTLDEQLSCLANAYRHLVDEGTLILDLPNPYLPYLTDDQYLNEFGDEPDFVIPDGRRIRRRYRIKKRDLSEQVIYGDIIHYVSHNGVTEQVVSSMAVRYSFRYEMEHLLTRCGFKVIEIYSDYDENKFGCSYPGELVLIAAKQGLFVNPKP